MSSAIAMQPAAANPSRSWRWVVSNRCLLLVLLLVCVGTALFFVREDKQEEEWLEDEDVAWRLAAHASAASPVEPTPRAPATLSDYRRGEHGRALAIEGTAAGDASASNASRPTLVGVPSPRAPQAKVGRGGVEGGDSERSTGRERERELLERELEEIKDLRSELAAAGAAGSGRVPAASPGFNSFADIDRRVRSIQSRIESLLGQPGVCMHACMYVCMYACMHVCMSCMCMHS